MGMKAQAPRAIERDVADLQRLIHFVERQRFVQAMRADAPGAREREADATALLRKLRAGLEWAQLAGQSSQLRSA